MSDSGETVKPSGTGYALIDWRLGRIEAQLLANAAAAVPIGIYNVNQQVITEKFAELMKLHALEEAHRLADIVGVNPSLKDGLPRSAAARDSLAERIDEKFEWVRAAAGERFDSLEFNAWISVAEITNDATGVAETMTQRFGVGAAEVLASPIILGGSPAEIAERLHERRERWGYSYIVVQGPKAHEFAPIVQALAGT